MKDIKRFETEFPNIDEAVFSQLKNRWTLMLSGVIPNYTVDLGIISKLELQLLSAGYVSEQLTHVRFNTFLDYMNKIEEVYRTFKLLPPEDHSYSEFTEVLSAFRKPTRINNGIVVGIINHDHRRIDITKASPQKSSKTTYKKFPIFANKRTAVNVFNNSHYVYN